MFGSVGISGLVFLTCAVSASRDYILSPKDHYVNDFEVHKISKEHGLNTFAEFNTGSHLPFYKVSRETLVKYKATLGQFYDIEEDVTITLKNNPTDFILVDTDDVMNVEMNTNGSVPWHLDRVSKRKLPLDGTFPYMECHTRDDLEVNTYVVDTGIDIKHPQFGGRAVWSENFVDSKDTDCNSHGTHVAGLIGSQDYGVCKNARLHAVKVLDCNGSGSLSGVIRGIEWVYKQHVSKVNNKSGRKVKTVINMSLGGGFSKALNKAIEYGVKHDDNFYVVVAAGNEDENACKGSPSSVKSILTVMASDAEDNRAWFSNWGSCADLYSPGVNVLSTIPGGKTAVYSGTSMASPVLAGVLNHYLDMYPDLNMNTIKEKLIETSTKEVISGERPDTSSNLVYLERS